MPRRQWGAPLTVGPGFCPESPQGTHIPHALVSTHLPPSGPPPPKASDEASARQDPCVRGKGMLSLTALRQASARGWQQAFQRMF